MAQTVADYMKNFKGAVSNPIKTVNNANASAAAAQVLEMVALAKTIGKDAVKIMNEQSGQMEKQLKFDQEFIKQVKAQEKVAQALIAGQKLNTKQQDELDDTMKKFYRTVEGYNINSGKYIKNLQKYVESEIPDIIKKRISNDIKYTTKTVESTGSKNISFNASGKTSDGGPIKMVRDIKRLLERSYTETKQFRGWVTDTWSSAWYTLSNGFGDLMDQLKSGDLWKDLLKMGLILLGSGVLGELFKKLSLPELSKVGGDFGNFIKDLLRFSATVGMVAGVLAKRFPKLIKLIDNVYTDIGARILYGIDALKELPIVKALGKFGAAIGKALEPLAKVLSNVVRKIPFMEKIGQAFGTAGKVFTGIGKVAATIGKGAVQVAKLAKAIPGIGLAVNVIFGFFDFFYGFVKTSGDMWTKIRGGLANLISGITFGLVSFQTMAKLFGVENNVDFGQYSGKDNRTLWQKITKQGQDYSKGPTGNMSQDAFNAQNLPSISEAPGNKKGGIGSKILGMARSIVGGNRKPGGYCARGVANALQGAGVTKGSLGHGYQVADKLKGNKCFTQFNASPEQLPKLPAGSVVSWGKGTTPYGHVSISDGSGNEYSDFVGKQRTTTKRKDGLQYGQPRVFVPNADLTPIRGGRGDGEEYGELTSSLLSIAKAFIPSSQYSLVNQLAYAANTNAISANRLSSIATSTAQQKLGLNSQYANAINQAQSYSNVDSTTTGEILQKQLTTTLEKQAKSKLQQTVQQQMPINYIENSKTDVEDITLHALQALLF